MHRYYLQKGVSMGEPDYVGVRVHQLDSCDKDITLQKIPKYYFVYATAERSSGA
jgi:hypothetical protein